MRRTWGNPFPPGRMWSSATSSSAPRTTPIALTAPLSILRSIRCPQVRTPPSRQGQRDRFGKLQVPNQPIPSVPAREPLLANSSVPNPPATTGAQPSATSQLSVVRAAGGTAIPTKHRTGHGSGPQTVRSRQRGLGALGRSARPTKRRAGLGIEPRMRTFRLGVLRAAGKVATPIKHPVGEGTAMTNIPAAMTVVSSTELHARTIAWWEELGAMRGR